MMSVAVSRVVVARLAWLAVDSSTGGWQVEDEHCGWHTGLDGLSAAGTTRTAGVTAILL